MKLNYIPWFMGEYFMCHKIEKCNILNLSTINVIKGEESICELFMLTNAQKYSSSNSTNWKKKVVSWKTKFIVSKCTHCKHRWIKYEFSIFLYLERGNGIFFRRPYIHVIFQPLYDLKTGLFQKAAYNFQFIFYYHMMSIDQKAFRNLSIM